jgi:nitronate monooxygenase
MVGLSVPVLLAPMAGVDSPGLSIAVANAGGMGACGALLMAPEAIRQWARDFRARSSGPFQMNLWVPDPETTRDRAHEREVSRFLATWGPAPADGAADQGPPEFGSQLEALLEVKPDAVSSIMGLLPGDFVERLRSRSIAWFATATTVAEARAAEAAGATAIIAQGMEAGGHRGSFDPGAAEERMVGAFALIPAITDAVDVPVIAAGGIADGRGIAAAMILGASAAMIGTGFLRCPEASIPSAWADALARTAPEETRVTRVFSGRAGRSLATRFIYETKTNPTPAPYPVQRGLTAAMRAEAVRANDLDRMQAWAGQSAALAAAEPAGGLVRRLWQDAQRLLDGVHP